MRAYSILVLFIVIGCQTKRNDIGESASLAEEIRFAEKFRVTDNAVQVLEPWPGAVESIEYEISEPPRKIICTSTTHLPFLEQLGVEERLIGFPGTQYITSERIIERVKDKKLVDVGNDGNLNIEMIIGLNPDLVIAFDMGGESTVLDKLVESDVPVIYNSDYLETSPLGRAEWIKFFGAIFHKREMADSIFEEVTNRYNTLKQLTNDIKVRPTVMSGVVYGDVWFLPGGNNWSAQFLQDGGGTYIMNENQKTGWLELDFEYVFEKGRTSDFWIGVSTFHSLQELQSQDNRYADFKAFQEGKVYNHTKKVGPEGGYDIFESGYARPDRVLADIIEILHPDLQESYETYYYEALP